MASDYRRHADRDSTLSLNARIAPKGNLNILSRREVSQLLDAGSGGLYGLWRQCSLAVLNAGAEVDDIHLIMRRNPEFRIAIRYGYWARVRFPLHCNVCLKVLQRRLASFTRCALRQVKPVRQ